MFGKFKFTSYIINIQIQVPIYYYEFNDISELQFSCILCFIIFFHLFEQFREKKTIYLKDNDKV